MRASIIAAILFLPAAANANYTVRHDQQLEQAVAEIVASKIGEIRGGFSYDEEPVLVTKGSDPVRPVMPVSCSAGGSGDQWRHGLALACGMPAYRQGKI